MIEALFRWFDRHPKTCIAPVLAFAMLAGAQLLVYSYGQRLMPEPFGYLIALALVLATLASLCTSLAWWNRNETARLVAAAVHQILAEQTVEMRSVPTGWNARTSVQGAVYRSERGRHADEPEGDWTQILEGLQPKHLDPPSGDVSQPR